MIKNVANDVVPTICIISLLVYKRHLDLTPSYKLLIDIWIQLFWIVTENWKLKLGKLFVFNINICLEIGQIVPNFLWIFQNKNIVYCFQHHLSSILNPSNEIWSVYLQMNCEYSVNSASVLNTDNEGKIESKTCISNHFWQPRNLQQTIF